MTPHGPRAVIVDDDEHIREILRRMLALAGVEVIAELGSGEDAVGWVAANEVDLVIMDIQMPGMGGVAATREIKRLHPAVTVFGFTGWGTADAQEMLSAGAVSVFEKTKLGDLIGAIKAEFDFERG